MGLFYSVCGTMQVRPGLAEEAAQYLRSVGGWPFNDNYAVIVEDGDIMRIALGHSMSFSTAGVVDKTLQEAAERFGVGATVFDTEAEGERGQLVTGALPSDRVIALVKYLDEQIEELTERRRRVQSGEERV